MVIYFLYYYYFYIFPVAFVICIFKRWKAVTTRAPGLEFMMVSKQMIMRMPRMIIMIMIGMMRIETSF